MPKLKPETLEARKNQILQAALVCFARSGYQQTSVDDISQEAGLSKGSIYTHFESKKALFLALLDRMIADTGLQPLLSTEDLTKQEKLDASLVSIISFANSEASKEYAFLLMEAWLQTQLDPEVNQAVANLYNQLRYLFAQLISQSVEAGEAKPVDPDAMASILIAIFDGLMVQAVVDEHAIDWQAISQTIRGMWIG